MKQQYLVRIQELKRNLKFESINGICFQQQHWFNLARVQAATFFATVELTFTMVLKEFVFMSEITMTSDGVQKQL